MAESDEIHLTEAQREAALARMEKAFVELTLDRVRSQWTHKQELLEPADFAAFFLSLQAESDRAVPIVTQAYIDAAVERLIVEEMNERVAGGRKSLVAEGGPLQTSAARITMAHALFWLRDDTAADLHLLRRIRNDFAHDPAASFDLPAVADRLRQHAGLRRMLRAILGGEGQPGRAGDTVGGGPQGIKRSATRMRGLKLECRRMYVAAAALTAADAIVELYAAPASWRAGLHPAAILSRPDVWPDRLKVLRDSVPRLLLDLMGQGEGHILVEPDGFYLLERPPTSVTKADAATE